MDAIGRKKTKKTSLILPASFFQQSDVVAIARELLGKLLFTQFEGEPLTGGIIIETEAYRGPQDRASHAYNNRRTKRTEVLFQKGGGAYVHLCYGIHTLINIVSNQEGIPNGVLLRAIAPTVGLETMLQRRGKDKISPALTSGPGAMCQALGIRLEHNGHPVQKPPIWIEESGLTIPAKKIIAGPRIGVGYAGEDALLPWRFRIVN